MPKPPFPHMMEHDVPLFASFVLTPEGSRFTKWEFDVHVGQGHLTQSEYDPAIMELALAVSRLRIDAVGWLDGIPWIFEVKPRAALTALGQVIAYRHFYRLEKFITPRLAIITDWAKPDARTIYAAEGIALFEVTEANEEQLYAACVHVQADCSQLIKIPQLP